MLILCSACLTPMPVAPCKPPCKVVITCPHCHQIETLVRQVEVAWDAIPETGDDGKPLRKTAEEMWQKRWSGLQIAGKEIVKAMPEGWRP